MSPFYERMLKLLLARQVREARSFLEVEVDREIERSTAALAALERERKLLNSMVTHAEQALAAEADLAAGPPNPFTPPDTPPPATEPREVSKNERSNLIKRFAFELAKETTDYTLTAQKVADRLNKEGFNLGTDVPGTMVGNVLFKSPEWSRVAKGVYRYVGPPLDHGRPQ